MQWLAVHDGSFVCESETEGGKFIAFGLLCQLGHDGADRFFITVDFGVGYAVHAGLVVQHAIIL